jgi:hypothetical protein
MHRRDFLKLSGAGIAGLLPFSVGTTKLSVGITKQTKLVGPTELGMLLDFCNLGKPLIILIYGEYSLDHKKLYLAQQVGKRAYPHVIQHVINPYPAVLLRRHSCTNLQDVPVWTEDSVKKTRDSWRQLKTLERAEQDRYVKLAHENNCSFIQIYNIRFISSLEYYADLIFRVEKDGNKVHAIVTKNRWGLCGKYAVI